MRSPNSRHFEDAMEVRICRTLWGRLQGAFWLLFANWRKSSLICCLIFTVCGLIALVGFALFFGQRDYGDPYACFGAGRYEAMSKGHVCP
jgi:hypothetical protein